jgi:hypothetical protein
MFMVDDRIVHLMPGLLGAKFFAKNKYVIDYTNVKGLTTDAHNSIRTPITIKGTGSLKLQVEKALKATYVKLHNGLDT